MTDSDAPTTRRLRAFEELVLQHSNDVGLLLHPKYGVVYASPAVEHVLGFTVEHFLGMLASSWVHPDDVPLAIEQRQPAPDATVIHSDRAPWSGVILELGVARC